MKKLIKTCWSIWDKTDRFVAIFSLIAIILISCTMCSCKSKDEPPEYTTESTTVLFDFSCVDDIIWSDDDGMFFIEYNDSDCFDYDNLAYLTGRHSWYGEYIMMDIDESLVSMFLNDQELYLKETDYLKKDDISMQYVIVETKITFPDSTINYVWEVKQRQDVFPYNLKLK